MSAAAALATASSLLEGDLGIMLLCLRGREGGHDRKEAIEGETLLPASSLHYKHGHGKPLYIIRHLM
jgi:hypothetical protein